MLGKQLETAAGAQSAAERAWAAAQQAQDRAVPRHRLSLDLLNKRLAGGTTNPQPYVDFSRRRGRDAVRATEFAGDAEAAREAARQAYQKVVRRIQDAPAVRARAWRSIGSAGAGLGAGAAGMAGTAGLVGRLFRPDAAPSSDGSSSGSSGPEAPSALSGPSAPAGPSSPPGPGYDSSGGDFDRKEEGGAPADGQGPGWQGRALSLVKNPYFYVPAGLAGAAGLGYLAARRRKKTDEEDDSEKEASAGARLRELAERLRAERDRARVEKVAAADRGLGEMPFTADQAATVAAADPVIATAAHNREHHPLNYWLNPVVRGPLSELYWRARRRMAAAGVGGPARKAVGGLVGYDPILPNGYPNALSPVGILLGHRAKREEARARFADSPMAATVARMTESSKERHRRRRRDEEDESEKEAAMGGSCGVAAGGRAGAGSYAGHLGMTLGARRRKKKPGKKSR